MGAELGCGGRVGSRRIFLSRPVRIWVTARLEMWFLALSSKRTSQWTPYSSHHHPPRLLSDDNNCFHTHMEAIASRWRVAGGDSALQRQVVGMVVVVVIG